jgi:hypothetical protein
MMVDANAKLRKENRSFGNAVAQTKNINIGTARRLIELTGDPVPLVDVSSNALQPIPVAA